MHELSIAENIAEIVREHLPSGNARVTSVRVRIGEMAGVVADSLTFCFGAITAGTPLEGARLEIDRRPLKGRCRACGRESPLELPLFLCPACGSNNLEVVSGRELEVAEIIIDDGKAP